MGMVNPGYEASLFGSDLPNINAMKLVQSNNFGVALSTAPAPRIGPSPKDHTFG